MSAAQILRMARAAGVSVTLDGGNLKLAASAAPPESVVEELSRNKAEIVELLRPAMPYEVERVDTNEGRDRPPVPSWYLKIVADFPDMPDFLRREPRSRES